MSLSCVVAGEPDRQSGFVCDIKRLDNLMREIVAETVTPFRNEYTAHQALWMICHEGQRRWTTGPPIVEWSLSVSPFLRFDVQNGIQPMITMTEQFEFSAAHRLHCDEYDADRNRQVFGKCNNPNGHGHNYIVEISIRGELEQTGQLISIVEFERIVKSLVIDRLDHKHLNLDVDHFRNLIPTVENIAMVIWQWLAGNLGGAQLSKVRVYETAKTWAEYQG